MTDTDRLSEILENISAKVYDKRAREDITWLSTTIGELRREIKTLAYAVGSGTSQGAERTPKSIVAQAIRRIKGQGKELAEIHDLLAEALGYHKDAEDDPNSPCPGDYVTGDHTSVTLAMEAAKILINRQMELEGLRGYTRCVCGYSPQSRSFVSNRCCPLHGSREAQYVSNGGTVESQELFELRRELDARKRQCLCAYWSEHDQIMPNPRCSAHGVEAHNKKMQGELAMNELRLLRRILLGENDG